MGRSQSSASRYVVKLYVAALYESLWIRFPVCGIHVALACNVATSTK